MYWAVSHLRSTSTASLHNCNELSTRDLLTARDLVSSMGRRRRVICRQVSGFQRQPPDFGLVFPLVNERIPFSRLDFLIRSRLRARGCWASPGTSTVSIRVDDPKSSVLPVCDKTLQKFQGRPQIGPLQVVFFSRTRKSGLF